jgi:Ca2+-binding EF-hand superfamily protein
LREEFFKDDVDHDGYVDKEELKNVLIKLYSNVFSSKELKELLSRYEDKKIDFYEFIGLYTAERIEEKLLKLQSDPEFIQSDAELANAKFVFTIYDTEDVGRIDKRELACMLRQMGKTNVDDQYLEQLLQRFAKKHKDSIEFDEFLEMLNYIKS